MSESSETPSERLMKSVSETGFKPGQVQDRFSSGKKILDSDAESFLALRGLLESFDKKAQDANARPEIAQNKPESRILARSSRGFYAYLQGSSPTSKTVKRIRCGF